jgi:hypothetical protein
VSEAGGGADGKGKGGAGQAQRWCWPLVLQWLLQYHKEVQPLLEAPQRSSRSSAAVAGGCPPTDIIHAIVCSVHLQRVVQGPWQGHVLDVVGQGCNTHCLVIAVFAVP